MDSEYFDCIIVGAGFAGCVLANRLTESGEHSVLLLEAGGSDNNIMIRMPTALGNLNAPIIMLAEKAADIILGKKPLP